MGAREVKLKTYKKKSEIEVFGSKHVKIGITNWVNRETKRFTIRPSINESDSTQFKAYQFQMRKKFHNFYLTSKIQIPTDKFFICF